MSMPSSSEEVATTAGSRPALSASSISPRCSLDTEPWWARASSGTAPGEAPDCAMICAGWTSPPAGQLAPVTRSSWISLSRAHSRSASRRELANTIVDRCASTRSTMRSSTCGQIDVRRSSPAAEPLTSPVVWPSSPRSSTGTTTSSSTVLLLRRLHDLDVVRAAEEPGDLLDRAHRGRQPDPLRGPLEQVVEALEGEGQVGAALGAGDRVHLVDDDRLDTAQRLAGLRGEQQEQRLRRGDEDVGRRAQEPAALVGRGVAGPDADGEVRLGQAEPGRGVPDAGQRGAQVALDVDGERLHR